MMRLYISLQNVCRSHIIKSGMGRITYIHSKQSLNGYLIQLSGETSSSGKLDNPNFQIKTAFFALVTWERINDRQI